MIDQMLGADPVALREFAELQGRSAQNLRQIASNLNLAVNKVRWQGADAADFQRRWNAAHSPHLQTIADSLDAAARSLKNQAFDQERTSVAKQGVTSIPLEIQPKTQVVPDLDLLLEHPALLRDLAPQEVARWWNALDSQERRRFLISHSLIAGNTNGIPFSDRIKANRFNAQNELDRMNLPKSPEQKYGGSAQTVTGPDVGPQDAEDGDPDKINYLKSVVKGDVQLAAYDPAKHSLVEMIGRLSAKTNHIITYVPGAFTNDSSFFKHQVQGLSNYVVQNNKAGSSVAFVYKGGEFPDGSVPDGLLEARGDSFLSANAPQLAAFQESVDVENTTIRAKTSNISHSWGARLTSGSEMAGAHYDQVIALSGAALDPSWKPQPGCEYLSMSYPDPLQTAEQLGVVGINYPMKDPHFEHRWYQPPTGSIWGGPFNSDNHQLIVSTGQENSRVLADLQARLNAAELRAAA